MLIKIQMTTIEIVGRYHSSPHDYLCTCLYFFTLTSILRVCLCPRAGEGGCGAEARRGGDGHPGDKVWRVHVLCAARVYGPVAYVRRSGR